MNGRKMRIHGHLLRVGGGSLKKDVVLSYACQENVVRADYKEGSYRTPGTGMVLGQ